MFEIKGKYGTAKFFADIVDDETIGQVMRLLNQKSTEGSKVRIMADCHAGAGCVIGTTMTITDKVIPNLVGVDIGCFTGDTQVWKTCGYESIESLYKKGERFMLDCFDEESKQFSWSYARAVKTRKNAELVEVRYKAPFQSREFVVRCTPDQRFLITSDTKVLYYEESELKWVEAKDLKEGMRLVADDAFFFVREVKPLDQKEDVYCLQVEDMHNFMIFGGVVVHNCGMEAVRLEEREINYKKLDQVIREHIPSGFDVRSSVHPYEKKCRLEELFCLKQISLERARLSLGSLGGGNHFIEVDESDDGVKYLVIHTGSRYLGKQVAEHYQDLAWKNLSKEKINEQIQKEIAVLKAEGREKEISEAIAKIKASFQTVPKELAYCEGQLFEHYIHDMKIVQEFAALNRQAIADVIVKQMNLHVSDSFTTIHNYIDTDAMILRKGSVSAKKGEKLIIPINMRDGSLICIGKGNEDYNFSAPHGAGRLMSRSQAKSTLSVDAFRDEMKEAGIYTTSCSQATLDEAPGAYKPMESILENIEDTVEIVEVIKPVYNFKAGN